VKAFPASGTRNKSRFQWLAAIGLLFAPQCALMHADTSRDGGRNLSVLLFSTRRLTSVTLAPLSTSAWISACASCAHEPFTAPVELKGTKEVFAGGKLMVTDEESHEQKSAAGLWHLKSDHAGVDVVLTLPSERYVAAVLNAETVRDEAPEALQAMAIVARTYALNGRHFSAAAGHLSADLCDSTECQAMRLGAVSSSIEDAVLATAGETLWFGGSRAKVFFSEHCGGVTEDAAVLWPRLHGVAYLQSHADPYCLRRGSAAWHTEISLTELASVASQQGWQLPRLLVSVQVSRRSRSKRALQVVFSGSGGHTSMLSASALRLGVGRALGWNRIRSDRYEVALRGGMLVFDGRGYGHGAGLCQIGASEMAAEHKSAREILAFYFPGTVVRIGPDDDGWQVTHASSLIVRSTQGESPIEVEKLEKTWQEALRRFPSHKSLTPQITFALSTELFRQMTSQPGWALASTQGARIVMQPAAVLNRAGSDTGKVLLHEMLHVLVEAEASDRVPLWLREGMVEELSGEAAGSSETMPAEALDAALVNAASWSASERAHHVAGWRVHRLAEHYGMSTLRGWLVSGVPPGVV
jgi:stage II sporulation protein D